LTDKTPIDTTMCVDTRGDLDDIAYPPSIGFLLIHLGVLPRFGQA
jgi:hypothetical protein